MQTIEFLKIMGEKMAMQKANKAIGLYKGDKEGFLEWINKIEIQIMINSFSNENIIKLVLGTISGSISEFILTFLDGKIDTPWADLKAHLIERYRVKTTEDTLAVSATEK